MPPSPPPITRYFQLEKRDLVYLKFILEAYEGLTTLSSLDTGAGRVALSYNAEVAEEVEPLLAALGEELVMRELTPAEVGFSGSPLART